MDRIHCRFAPFSTRFTLPLLFTRFTCTHAHWTITVCSSGCSTCTCGYTCHCRAHRGSACLPAGYRHLRPVTAHCRHRTTLTVDRSAPATGLHLRLTVSHWILPACSPPYTCYLPASTIPTFTCFTAACRFGSPSATPADLDYVYLVHLPGLPPATACLPARTAPSTTACTAVTCTTGSATASPRFLVADTPHTVFCTTDYLVGSAVWFYLLLSGFCRTVTFWFLRLLRFVSVLHATVLPGCTCLRTLHSAGYTASGYTLRFTQFACLQFCCRTHHLRLPAFTTPATYLPPTCVTDYVTFSAFAPAPVYLVLPGYPITCHRYTGSAVTLPARAALLPACLPPPAPPGYAPAVLRFTTALLLPFCVPALLISGYRFTCLRFSVLPGFCHLPPPCLPGSLPTTCDFTTAVTTCHLHLRTTTTAHRIDCGSPPAVVTPADLGSPGSATVVRTARYTACGYARTFAFAHGLPHALRFARLPALAVPAATVTQFCLLLRLGSTTAGSCHRLPLPFLRAFTALLRSAFLRFTCTCHLPAF